MSNKIIHIDNISKSYKLKHLIGNGKEDMLIDSVKNIGKRLLKKSQEEEEFWALQNISFDIERGDRVGIIGRNGAGKSTLLKILSRIVAPTTGRIEYEGRMASLLEVGTGFHGDLSGRENIYLNGSILGMSRKEISARFDEIVAFSEVEKFLDTPVKRYSSGMYVRLAFSVAAHLQSEILIVDEVLAVGDAVFQRKCLGKMNQISSEGGRTILFVSHSMQAVQKLCNVGVFLKDGKLVESGPIEKIIDRYLQAGEGVNSSFNIPKPSTVSFGYVLKVMIEDLNGNLLNEIPVGSFWRVRIQFKLEKETEHFIMGLGIVSALDIPIRTSWSEPKNMHSGDYEIVFENNDLLLTTGNYKLVVGLSSNQRAFQYLDNQIFISVSDAGILKESERIVNTQSGLILNPMKVTLNKLL